MSPMATSKKKTTAKKSAPVKKAAPKKATAKKAPAKKATAKKAPAKKTAAKKTSPVINIKNTTTSATPDLKVSINTAQIHDAIDKTADNVSLVINDFLDDAEKVIAEFESSIPKSIKKTSFFKRIFRRKK
jgi:hypothetical protein